jgi:hypothetical protein
LWYIEILPPTASDDYNPLVPELLWSAAGSVVLSDLLEHFNKPGKLLTELVKDHHQLGTASLDA